MSKAGERLHALDAVRAVMMLLGLVIHVACSYTVVGLPVWPYKDTATTPVADVVLHGIHVFRMPIFFVMAGLFSAMLLGRRGTIGLLRNRAVRIGVPFVVGWLVLYPLLVSGFVWSQGVREGGLEAGRQALRAYVAGGPLYADSTAHLWFLYVLLYLYIVAVGLAWLVRRLAPATRERALDAFDALLGRWWRPLPLAALSALTLLPMRVGTLDTSTSFVPAWRVLLAYGVFFGFGWLLWHRRARLASFTHLAWTQVALGIALMPVQQAFVERGVAALPGRDWSVHLATAATGSLSVWFLVFGITGLFLRHLDRPLPKVRYLVDASYWIYLVHLPFTTWGPSLLSGLDWPAEAKMLTLLLLITPPILLSYHYLVRGSFVGVVLNGRRFERVWPFGAGKHRIVDAPATAVASAAPASASAAAPSRPGP